MATEPLKTVITQGTKLSVAVAGPQGPAGPTGPAGGVTSVAGKTGPVTLVSADISDATSAATANTVVKRDSNGGVYFGQTSSGDFGVRAYTGNGSALAGVATGFGASFSGASTDGVGIFVSSSNSTGIVTFTTNGDYHAVFGSAGSNRSFIARVNGAIGWFRGAFTGRIQAPATLAADVTWTLPTTGGNLAIVASAAGTIVSADISDATSAATANTVVKRDSEGRLRSKGLTIFDTTSGEPVEIFGAGVISGPCSYELVDASGSLGILRAFTNSTEANGLVDVGDVWWDTTLNKARTRLA